MEIEVVISGIATFVNMANEDESIIGPSVILIKADQSTLPDDPGHDHGAGERPHGGHQQHGPHHCCGAPGQDPPPGDVQPVDNDHIPYLAYDTRRATVNYGNGFSDVPNADGFRFLPIRDLEVAIEGHDPAVPILDSTFSNVLATQEYWPEAYGRRNPDAVPPRGERPKTSVVTSWMQFGRGKVSGGRLCPFKWRFTRLNGDAFSRHFAEEAIYSFDDSEATDVRVLLRSLADGETVGTLIFRPQEGCRKLTLFLGNNIRADMAAAVQRRRRSNAAGPAGHFAFFSRLAHPDEVRRPQLPLGVAAPDTEGIGGGGPDGGICGPIKG